MRQIWLGIIGTFCLLMNFAFAQAQSQIRGTVVNEDGDPLAGAVVFIPKIKAGAYTNSEGIYSIPKLPAGTYEVIAYYYGYDTTFLTVNLPLATTITQKFVLVERMVFTDEVTIVGQQTGKINKTEVETGLTRIDPQEIDLLPSVGTPDLAQFLQVLPGVVFTGDQGGQLYIRGGTPIQNMVLLDGSVVYSPFHSIGLFSVFDPDYVRSIDVYSAAYPGEFGGRISSVIDIKTRNGSLKETKGKLNINPFSASAMLEGPLVKGKSAGAGVSYLVSARNNYIDRTGQAVYPYINEGEGLPYNFLDLFGKVTMTDGINFANLFAFRQTDNVNLEFPADIGWESIGGGGNFQTLPSGAGAIISGFFSYSQYNTSLRSQTETFPRRSSINGFSGGLEVGYIYNSVDEFNFGTQFLGFSTDYTFTNSFGFITEQASSNSEAAIYANYKKVFQEERAGGRNFERAVLEPSVHLHYYNNQRTMRFEPRIRGKLNFTGLSLSFAAGTYSQNLMAAVSDRDVVNLFQGFLSAPTQLQNQIKSSTLQTSWHLLTGVEIELIDNLTTNVEGWYKNFTQLTNINREKVFPEDPNFITETGVARGVDLILKYRTKNIYAYTNYGLAQVVRTDRLDRAQPRTYNPIYDRRHTVNVVAAYQSDPFTVLDDRNRMVRPKFAARKWEVSIRWSLGSGFPFTQTQGYFEKLNFFEDGAQTDIATQNGQLGLLLADEINAGRLPYYHRLDFAAKRRWLVRNQVLLELSLNAINLYNRNNIFFFDRVAFEPVYQLPFLPSLGFTAKF
ncbi:MAG: TonB-dependent receptor [Bacteroidota bacterium]